MLPDEARTIFFQRADNLLHRLSTQHNVVIKVDRELPKCLVSRLAVKDTPYSELRMDKCPLEEAGYVAVEPLVEE